MKSIAISLLATLFCNAAELQKLISPEEISAKITQAASILDARYQGEELTVVMVMKGALCVTADLIRSLKTPTVVEYIKASSYGQNGSVRGNLTIQGFDNLDLEGKNVLVIDDIFDTGTTMEAIVDRLREKNPKSLQSLVLLSKNVPKKTGYRPDFVLFHIEDKFVVGYGLDYKELYRGLPGIYYFD